MLYNVEPKTVDKLWVDSHHFEGALLTLLRSNALKMLSIYCDSGVPFWTPEILLNSCKYSNPLVQSIMEDL